MRFIRSLFILSVFFGSVPSLFGFQATPIVRTRSRCERIRLYSSEKDGAAQDALERTATHLKKLQGVYSVGITSTSTTTSIADPDAPPDPLAIEREKVYQVYIQKPANTLKEILKERKLPRNGRKPDLARRLADDDLLQLYDGEPKDRSEDLANIGVVSQNDDDNDDDDNDQKDSEDPSFILSQFAGIPLSLAAGSALARAKFLRPSPIQAAAIPALVKGESLVLHAETGSGKTLAYLLHMTEALWNGNVDDGRFLVLTPTRELAAQVAGVATVLSPPGSVRMVANPSNLMTDGQKDRGEGQFGGRVDAISSSPRLFIGSAKAIMHSLYGDGKLPASPTPKPLAMEFLQSVQCVVLDEVDRLLNVKKSRAEKQYKKIHERPAAVLVAALMRLSLGRTQIVAASATVGRPLKRELTRVMGLPPQECPRVVVASSSQANDNDDAVAFTRAVTIPSGVEHYVMEADGRSDGKMLTMAYKAIQKLNYKPRRMLMVLSRGFGLNPKNVVGALRHFQCSPTPENLIDRLYAEGTDDLIEAHRQVSGASGVGEKVVEQVGGDQKEYLLVTGEDSVRGLHLDGLDLVFVLGRPNGPDEYTHIAGRTGRAGQPGKVINIVGAENGGSLSSWESMLGIRFRPTQLEDLASL